MPAPGNQNRSDQPQASAGSRPGLRGNDSGSALRSLVRVERVIQLALVLPAAVLIGWAAGAALDHWLHRHWIAIAGLLFGAVSGFVEIFRMVSAMSKD